MSTPAQIAIIGAGPAGLMAAEQLAQRGHAVTIYDRMPSPGRKLLIAGRGGLNLTHSEPLDAFLERYGAARGWLEPSIRAFPPQALRDWCEGLGEKTFVGSSGRVFPERMKAVQLLRAWLKRLEGLGVQYRPRHRWLGWQGKALRFADATGQALHVEADAVLLALGGASWPRLGSDGGWAAVLEKAGVSLAPLEPANCGFVVGWSEHLRAKFAGVPLKPVAVTHAGVTRQGEAMITAQGIEGGVIYALSGALREAIARDGKAEVMLDLRPGMSCELLQQKFMERPRANKSLSTYLGKMGFSPLATTLLRECLPPAQVAALGPEELAMWLKALPLRFTATTGMARAISSAGGVRQEAVTAEFMLKKKPGIFVAGEMLDWEAPTGGYLLQGCFSTAVAAAKCMDAWVNAQAVKPVPKTAAKPSGQMNLF